MRINRLLSMRRARARRAHITQLRVHNRALNALLARRDEIHDGPELVAASMEAVAARSQIGTLSRRLGLTWTEARAYV